MNRKKIGLTLVLVAGILALVPAIGSAQILYSEDFGVPPQGPSGPMPAGWALFNVDGRTPAGAVSYVNNAWVRREDFANDVNDICAFSTSWYSPAGAADDWMITPAINLLTANVLTWNAITYDPSYRDGYEVRIGTAQTVAGMTGGTQLFSTAAENSAWTPRSANIPASFNNQPVYIGFHNNSTDKFLLLIDDIVVQGVVPVELQSFQAE